MKRLSEINEGFWKDGIKRAKSGETRIEDGVKLEIGTSIFVKNRKYDYDSLIKYLFNKKLVDFGRLGTYAGQVRKELDKTGESTIHDYYFRIGDSLKPNTAVAEFFPYDELQDADVDISDLDEDDYRTMCKGVVERLAQMDEIRFIRGACVDAMVVFWIDYNKPHSDYRGYSFCNAFRKHFGTEKFGEVYSVGDFIAIDIDYDCLRYYEEAVQFTQEYMDKLDNGVPEDQINEGFWKDSIKRAKDNTERIEDRINSNVYDLKPLDFGLPFLVASNLLSIDDDRQIVFGDYIEGNERKKIEKLGWRLPKMSELKRLLKKTKQTYREDIPGRIVYRIHNDKAAIVFALSDNEQYAFRLFTEDTNPNNHKADVIYLSPSVHSGNELRYGEEQIIKFLSAYVLLVKDKKVNEGFWKDGIKRAKENKTRLEDINPINDVFNFFKTCIKMKFPKTDKEPTLKEEAESTYNLVFSPSDGKNYFLNFNEYVVCGKDIESDTRKVYTAFWRTLDAFVHMKRVRLSNADMISNADKYKQDLKRYENIKGVFLERLQRTISPKLTKEEVRNILLDTNYI